VFHNFAAASHGVAATPAGFVGSKFITAALQAGNIRKALMPTNRERGGENSKKTFAFSFASVHGYLIIGVKSLKYRTFS